MLAAARVAAQVTTAQYGNARLNANTHETKLTPLTVTATSFGRVATFPVDGDVYAQPLYRAVRAGRSEGTRISRDVLFVATEAGSVYAFDAQGTDRQPLWKRRLLDAGEEPLTFQDVLCPFIRPTIAITPTPVIDTIANALYVLARARTRDSAGHLRFVQRLYAIDLSTGQDIRSPAEIRASVNGTGAGARNGRVDFDPLRENPRAALLLDRGVLYLSWASSCDVGPYHGWIMAYDAATLRQIAAFNTSPDGSAAGVWQGDAGLAADENGFVYAVTGNGTFDERAPRRNYGNSILQLHLADNSLSVASFFTPSNQAMLDRQDGDLGSSGPMLLPSDEATKRPLVIVTGKDGMSYVVDRAHMGGYQAGNNPHARQVVHTSAGGFGAAAYWNGRLFIWGSDTTLLAYSVKSGQLQPNAMAAHTRTSDPGSIPVVSANGDRDGIVWAMESRRWRGPDLPGVLHAYLADDVRQELYNSEMNASRDRMDLATRFSIPTVANGRVFVGAKREVDVFGTLGSGIRRQ